MITVSHLQTTFAATVILLIAALTGVAAEPTVTFKPATDNAPAQFNVGGKKAVVYRYGPSIDLPHYILFSPSGKQLTIEQTNPYPHHRCFWFADTVQLAGKRKVSFYNAWYTRLDKKDPQSPFRDHIRNLSLTTLPLNDAQLAATTKLVWEMDETVPVLDEQRSLTLTDLGDGQYFLDIRFTVTANYGDVNFVSDAVHYAWPYLRMTPAFSVKDGGGTLTNSEGGVNQQGTHGKVATWVDYSNTLDGVTEGLTVFSHPDNEHPHRWLTRDYGTFGPRRADERSGKRFTVKQGESLCMRVGVLVHQGNVEQAQVSKRYEDYCAGKLGGLGQ